METRAFGRTGLTVSVLGFGGAEIGFEGGTEQSTKEIVSAAFDAGITLFDTAAAYLESEKLLGAALQGKRERITLVTKCGMIDGFSRSDWSKAGILKTIQQSLKNLRTDYLDVVLLHSCSHLEFQWAEAGAALQEAKEKGYARYIGYSGDGNSAYEAVKSDLFDVLETSVNVADQECIELTLPLAAERRMAVIAKRPLANVAWRWKETPPPSDYHRAYWERFAKLQFDFQQGDLAAAVQTALKFTLAQQGVACAIVGTTKPSRLKENVALASGPSLSPADIGKLRARWKAVATPSWVSQV